MFKKQPKIKQIAMTSSGDFVFTIGLAKDGKCYSWDTVSGSWKPYISNPLPPQEPANAS